MACVAKVGCMDSAGSVMSIASVARPWQWYLALRMHASCCRIFFC